MTLRNTERFKGVNKKKEFKGTQKYKLKHCTFYYNNDYPIYKEAKYSTSYWLQELSLEQFRGTKEEDE